MARRPSSQKECSPEGRPWGRACVLQGKAFWMVGLLPTGLLATAQQGSFGSMDVWGSLNSNWARFSTLQKQN